MTRPTARAFLVFLFATAAASGQYYPLHWYTSTDGLAHNTVRSLVQDSSGYLWAATVNGVSRFDGTGFRAMDNPAPMLRDKSVRCIVLDSTGYGVWCVVENEYVYHIDRYGRVTCLHEFRDGALAPVTGVDYMISGSGGVLWFSCGDGIRRLHPSTGWMRIPTGGRCWRVVEHRALGEIWTIVSQSRILRIRRDGTVAGTVDLRGLTSRQLEPRRLAPRRPDPITVFTLAANPAAGGMWIVCNHGLFAAGADPDHMRFFSYPRMEGFVYFTPGTDAEGNIWCVMSAGGTSSYEYRKIAWSDGAVLQVIGNNQDFSRMLPFGCLVEDREGTVWIGCDGLAHFRGSGVLNYCFAWEGMPCVPRNMIRGPRGELLLATWSGVYRFAGDLFARQEFLTGRCGLPGTATSRVFADQHGTVHWFQLNQGSFRYRDGRVERDRPDPQFTVKGAVLPVAENGIVLADGSFATMGMAAENVVTFLDARDRRSDVALPVDGPGESVENGAFCAPRRRLHASACVAVASSDHLYLVTSGRTVRKFDFPGGARGGVTPSLCEDSSGAIWIGFEKPAPDAALYRFDGERMRAFTAAQLGLPGSAVNALCAHPNGRDLLVGTSYGLYAVDASSFLARKRLTIDDGLCSDRVLGIYPESGSVLWLLTGGGVSRWADRGEVAPPLRAPIITAVGTGRELTLLPLRDPAPVFTALPEHIAFRYAVLSFRRRPLFSTRLVGYQDAWSAPSEATDIRFTNLDPGDYAFQVRTVDPDDLRHSAPGTFAFRIPTPWYATWWFITLAIAAAAALLFLGYRARLASVLRVEKMRARIAFDIHDEIGSTLTGISFLSAMAEKETSGVLPATEQRLRRIGETTRSVIGLMSDIIWSLKPEQDFYGTFHRRLGDLAAELAEGSGIAIDLRIPDDLDRQAMPMIARRNLYFIAREAIHNAVKHASCSRIDVALERRGRVLVLTVADNGHGMSAPPAGTPDTDAPPAGTPDTDAQPRGGTGMTSMRRRSAEIGGTLTIAPGREGGTCVQVVVKV